MSGSEAVQFLQKFDPDGRHNLVAFNPTTGKPAGAVTFVPLAWDEIAKWVDAQIDLKSNVYFTANLPSETAPNKKLAKTDIGAIRAVYIDVDPQGDGSMLDAERQRIAEVMDKLCESDLPPSFVIDSGGGFQALWRITTRNVTEDVIRKAEEAGAALAAFHNGDAVMNIDRILRLPGTVNVPTQKKAAKGRIERAASVYRATDVVTTLEAFAGLAVAQPAADWANPAANSATATSGFDWEAAAAEYDWSEIDKDYSSQKVPRTDIIAALEALPNNFNRNGWVRIGMAVHAGGGEFADFDLWSRKWAGYNEKDTRAAWKSFSKNREITVATLFFAVRQFVPNWKRPSSLRGNDAAGQTTDEPKTEAPGPEQKAKVDADTPPPILPPLSPSKSFPVDALPKVLADAVRAIVEMRQVSASMAGQAVLSVTALTCQSLVDVAMPAGRGETSPTSLYFVTIAVSGERKTTVDADALLPIKDHTERLREDYELQHAKWTIDVAAWTAAKKVIDNNRNLSPAQRRKDLEDLGPKPEAPLTPLVLVSDFTIEGLLKSWVKMEASLGLFSSDAGQVLGSYSMTGERNLMTAASLSLLWDAGQITRLRATDDNSAILHGRRLSAHLMVQPEAAIKFLSNPVFRDQGLLSRMLLAYPESTRGNRPYKPTPGMAVEALEAYRRHLYQILLVVRTFASGKANELKPPALKILPEAKAAWITFHDEVERQCGAGGRLAELFGFADKAAAMACRLAAMLTVCQDAYATHIAEAEMQSAITLMRWYVDEVERLQEWVSAQSTSSPEEVVRAVADKNADRLLRWVWKLAEKGELPIKHGETALTRDRCLRLGPNATRNRGRLQSALNQLIDAGFVRLGQPVNGYPALIFKLPEDGNRQF